MKTRRPSLQLMKVLATPRSAELFLRRKFANFFACGLLTRLRTKG
jgi:hypothetical protein